MPALHHICGVGVGVGALSVLAGMPFPGTQGWATVVVVTGTPELVTLVFPITVAPPTVAPTAAIPVVALAPVAGVAPAVAVPGRVPDPQGPATVLMVDPTLLFGAPGRTPTGLEVSTGIPLAAPGAPIGFWLGVMVVFWLGVVVALWLGVVVVVWLGVRPGIVACADGIPAAGTPPTPLAPICAQATLMTRMMAREIRTFLMRSLLGVGEPFTLNCCVIYLGMRFHTKRSESRANPSPKTC
jgi:hypothetical protein